MSDDIGALGEQSHIDAREGFAAGMAAFQNEGSLGDPPGGSPSFLGGLAIAAAASGDASKEAFRARMLPIAVAIMARPPSDIPVFISYGRCAALCIAERQSVAMLTAKKALAHALSAAPNFTITHRDAVIEHLSDPYAYTSLNLVNGDALQETAGVAMERAAGSAFLQQLILRHAVQGGDSTEPKKRFSL